MATTRAQRRKRERAANKALERAGHVAAVEAHLSDFDVCYRCNHVRESRDGVEVVLDCPDCNGERFEPLYVPHGVLAVTTGEVL